MAIGYHSGELKVQSMAGATDEAAVVGRIIRSSIPPAAREFLQSQLMAVLSSIDAEGRVWASLVSGEPGFMQAADDKTVRLDAAPCVGDPLLGNLRERDEVGMIAIEFASRRRIRLNGRAEIRPEGGILVRAEQVYANCPKYIQAREWSAVAVEANETEVRQLESLNEKQKALIEKADAFFIASFHAEGGADASHRGGNPGFVRVSDEKSLVWPDYSGNNMFQTLGNIAANPNAGLLFIDFEGGDTLQLSGKAEVVWDEERKKEFAGAERLVEFRIERIIEIADASRLRWKFLDYSKFNPA